MVRLQTCHLPTLVLVLAQVLAATAAAAAPEPAPAPVDEVAAKVSQIEAKKPPKMDVSRISDAAYRESFNDEQLKFQSKRGARIKELYAQFPDHPQAKRLMLDRWLGQARTGERKPVVGETAALLAAAPDESWRSDLLYVRAEAQVWPPVAKVEIALQAVEEFIHAAPRDERGAELLFFLAQSEPDVKKRAAFYHRAAAGPYAKAMYGQLANDRAAQTERIGKPFELSFADELTGRTISVQQDLHDKIVVVEFWATWCGPCVAEMPELKELYSKYKDRGVEFIGVNLDESADKGGHKALQDFLASNPLPWPQYYQGNGVESKFSSEWNVHLIPQMFIVGRDGRLVNTTADGQIATDLREMLNAEQVKAAPTR